MQYILSVQQCLTVIGCLTLQCHHLLLCTLKSGCNWGNDRHKGWTCQEIKRSLSLTIIELKILHDFSPRWYLKCPALIVCSKYRHNTSVGWSANIMLSLFCQVGEEMQLSVLYNRVVRFKFFCLLSKTAFWHSIFRVYIAHIKQKNRILTWLC